MDRSPSVTRQWWRDGAVVPGATGTTLRLTTTDVGSSIHVVETARTAGRLEGTAVTETVVVEAIPTLTNVTTPRVTGTPRVGQTLTADPGSWDGTASFTYQWFRDGTAIGSPSGRAAYTVVAADAARSVHVVVTASGSGRRPGTAPSAPVAVAKVASATSLALSASRTTVRKRVTATLRVTASGLDPAGTVTLYDGSRRLATVRLSRGAATYRLPALAAGKHRVKAVYAGDAQSTGSSRTVTLTVTKT